MNSGRTVFAQLLELLPRRAFDLAVERYDGDKKLRRFSCNDQLLCMVFAQVTGRSSLRETVTCLRALGSPVLAISSENRAGYKSKGLDVFKETATKRFRR